MHPTTITTRQEMRSPSSLAQTAFAFGLGLVFAATGATKLLLPDGPVADFQRWGLPAPHVLVAVAGVLELGGALLLIGDVGVRAAGSMLAVEMSLAGLVAGTHDGGVQLVVPPMLIVGCLGLVLARSRALRVVAQSAQGTSTESSVGASRATTYSAGSVSERFSRTCVSRGGTYTRSPGPMITDSSKCSPHRTSRSPESM
jgi:putative oxidoreductase